MNQEVDYGNHKSLYYSSIVIGYTYATLWGASFLGCNLDFVIYNVSGFFFYTAYNTAGFFYPKETGIVAESNDLFFGWWALIMTIVIAAQCFCMYPRYSNRVTILCKLVNTAYWGLVIGHFSCYAIFNIYEVKSEYWNVWYIMSYLKLIITLTKYIPQVYWNYLRKSTKGWSHTAVIMDFMGGVLSSVQIIVEYFNGNDEIFGNADGSMGLNVAKFGLSWISIAFDTVFLIQHYILYNPKYEQNQEQKKLNNPEVNKQKDIEIVGIDTQNTDVDGDESDAETSASSSNDTKKKEINKNMQQTKA